MAERMFEIGIVNFPGAQMAAVLGMTDLFTTAELLAQRARREPDRPLLRISHWEWSAGAG